MENQHKKKPKCIKYIIINWLYLTFYKKKLPGLHKFIKIKKIHQRKIKIKPQKAIEQIYKKIISKD